MRSMVSGPVRATLQQHGYDQWCARVAEQGLALIGKKRAPSWTNSTTRVTRLPNQVMRAKTIVTLVLHPHCASSALNTWPSIHQERAVRATNIGVRRHLLECPFPCVGSAHFHTVRARQSGGVRIGLFAGFSVIVAEQNNPHAVR